MTAETRRMRVFLSRRLPILWRVYCPCCDQGWHCTRAGAHDFAIRHARTHSEAS